MTTSNPQANSTPTISCFYQPVSLRKQLDEILTGLISSAGMIGSILCIYVITIIVQHNHTLSYLYLRWIFIFNLLYTMFIFPIGIIRNYSYYNSVLCQQIFLYWDVYIYYPFNGTFVKASLLTVTLMALDRYLLVAHALKYRHHLSLLTRHFPLYIILITLYAFLFSIYRFFEYQIIYDPTTLCYTSIASVYSESYFFRYVIGYINSVFLLIVPSIAMWTFTTLLAIKIMEMSRKVSEMRGTSTIREVSMSQTSTIEGRSVKVRSRPSSSLNRLNVVMSVIVNFFTIPEWLYLVNVPTMIESAYGSVADDVVYLILNVSETFLPIAMTLAMVFIDKNFKRTLKSIYKRQSLRMSSILTS